MPNSLLTIVTTTPKQNKIMLIGEKSLTRFSSYLFRMMGVVKYPGADHVDPCIDEPYG